MMDSDPIYLGAGEVRPLCIDRTRARFWKVIVAMAQQKSESHHEHNAKPLASGSQLIDPVCGMRVTKDSPQHVQHKGESFYFCSIKCLETFKRDPEKFTVQRSSDEKDHEQVAPGTIYTCPMHPEIRQDHPGSCPKCGMALEPLMPSLDDDNPELKDFSRRFWWMLSCIQN